MVILKVPFLFPSNTISKGLSDLFGILVIYY